MFGWFSAKCPLNTWEKTWAETRMRWLADQFGIERLLRAEVVLPTEQFFPDPSPQTLEDAQRWMDRVCGYMAVDPLKIQLEVCDDVQMPGATGHYDRGERTIIRVAASQLEDPQALVATLAHELSHELLLGSGLLTADVADHEWVTDLLPVCLGMGVFAANATVHEAHGRGWWTVGKQGYLPARIFGYAFALFSFMRREHDPDWVKHLRLDASSSFREGLRFLCKTGDSLFHPETIRAKRMPPSPSELVHWLRTGSPTVRLAALWDIRDHVVAEADVVAEVIKCLDDRDQAIPGEAGRTLGALGSHATVAMPPLLKALGAVCDDTRVGAAYALGALRQQPDIVIPELCVLLEGTKNRAVLGAAAQALGQFGVQAEAAAPRLVNELAAALAECNQAQIELLASALLAIAPDPKQYLRKYLPAGDREFRRRALAALKEQRG